MRSRLGVVECLELAVARAALMEVGLGDIAPDVVVRSWRGVQFPTYPYLALRPDGPLISRAFVLAHQVHDPAARLDDDGYVECPLCEALSCRSSSPMTDWVSSPTPPWPTASGSRP